MSIISEKILSPKKYRPYYRISSNIKGSVDRDTSYLRTTKLIWLLESSEKTYTGERRDPGTQQ